MEYAKIFTSFYLHFPPFSCIYREVNEFDYTTKEGRLQMESCEESDGTAHEKLRIYVKKVYILQQKQELPVITISGLNDSDELPF